MLFKTGQLVTTPAALALCIDNGVDPMRLVHRHVSGDFGELSADDTAANVHGVQHDLRILSAYTLNGTKLYVITEWDRSVTTVLLASEY